MANATTSYRNAAARSFRSAVDSVAAKCNYVSIRAIIEPGEEGLAVAEIRLRDPVNLPPEAAQTRVEIDLAESRASMVAILGRAVAHLRGRDQDYAYNHRYGL